VTVNLSFRRQNPMTRGIDTFYSALHTAMYSLGDVQNAPFPTAREFREFVRSAAAAGLGSRVCLDAGCGGTAVNTHSLLAAGADGVTALDVNLDSLARVRASLREHGLTGAHLVRGSLLALPVREATYDLVVCSGVVHHTPDPEGAVRELYRVVKPGGRAYISVYCFEASWALAVVRLWRALAWVIPYRVAHLAFRRVTAVNNFVLDHMYVPILWVFRAAEFQSLLESAGFVVDRSFRSAMDPFGSRRLLGRPISGDGLLRVFECHRTG